MLAPKLLVISHKCVLVGSFLKQRSNENTEKAASLGDEHENKLSGHHSAQWGSHIRQERQLQLTSETHFLGSGWRCYLNTYCTSKLQITTRWGKSFQEIRHKSLPAVWTYLHTKWQLTGEVGFSDCWLNSVGCYRCQTECWGALCWATLTATPHIPLCSSSEHTHLAANTMNSYTHTHTIQWHWLISHSCLLLFCTKHFAETNLSVKILSWIHLNLNELSASVSISLQAGHTHLRKVQEIFVSIWADGIAARRTLACANQCRRLPVSLMGVDRSSVAAVLWNRRC